MLHSLDFLRGMDLLSVVVRVLLALVCGGMIGIERAEKRRPAGFRTHILICLGAAITAMTSVHLFVTMHYYLDVEPGWCPASALSVRAPSWSPGGGG